MNAQEARAISTVAAVEKSYNITKAFQQIKSAAQRGERETFLGEMLTDEQFKYLGNQGYAVLYNFGGVKITW